MARYRLLVRYDGTDFSGSQFNPGSRTVDGTLKVGLEKISGLPVHLLWAGRTDTGVHAEGNVATFDAELSLPAAKLAVVLNSYLPPDLEIRSAAQVEDDFHPRFAATKREYVYRIFCGSDVPLDRQRYTAAYQQPWRQELVEQALDLFGGEHCFVNYCQRAGRDQGLKTIKQAAECWCSLDQPGIAYHGAEVWLSFRANRFLRNMIRRLVGAVFAVNEAALTPEQLAAALNEQAINLQFKPAPAKGLTLIGVEYEG